VALLKSYLDLFWTPLSVAISGRSPRGTFVRC